MKNKVRRYLLLYLIVDNGKNMSGAKIAALNNSLQELLAELCTFDDEELDVYVKLMTYGSHAVWRTSIPVNIKDMVWEDLATEGNTQLKQAFELLNQDVDRIKKRSSYLETAIVWISGTDETAKVNENIKEILSKKCIEGAIRTVVKVGNISSGMWMEQFVGNKELILNASSMKFLRRILGRTDGCAYEENESVLDFFDIYDKSSVEGSYLRKMMALYPSVLEEPKRFKALLLDYLPDDRMRRNLLYLSLDERIPMEIVAAKAITNFEKTSWTKRLVDGYGCNVDIAREIVEQWLDALGRKINEVQSGTSENDSKIMGLAIDELDLSPRSYNALRRAGINSISDFLNYGREAMGVRNLGRKALEEVLERLIELGIKLEPAENGGVPNPGKEKCNKLREIRIKIAHANGIKYKPVVCNHQGPCAGTCPACDEEIRYIDEMLQKKRERGETIDLVGIAEREIAEAGIDPEIDEDIVMGTVPVLILEDDTEDW